MTKAIKANKYKFINNYFEAKIIFNREILVASSIIDEENCLVLAKEINKPGHSLFYRYMLLPIVRF